MGALTLSLAPPDHADDLSRHVRRDADCESFEVAVTGARCAGCIAKIEKGVTALPGVAFARLNLSTGKLLVRGHDFAPQAVLRRLRDLGYQARPFEAAETLSAEDAEGRFLLRCLAVSGLGTVLAMGLTDAVWYSSDMAPALRQGFFWLAAVVTVPASLYAGRPFFRSAWKGLKARTANMDLPISLAVVLALGLSLYQAANQAAHTYFDAAVMLVFLLLVGRYLDYRLRDKARGAARHLLALQSLLVRRLGPQDTLETVSARDIAVGDRVLVAGGERVPVNGVLEGDTDLDVSLVTGEVLPKAVSQGMTALAGSIVSGAPVVLRATARVEDSLVADLARLLEAGQQSRSQYVRLADRAARLYVPAVFVLSTLVLGGWLVVGASLSVAVTSAITVLIITCPCALGLAVPAVQVVATGRLFRRGVFVKSGDALERLAEVDLAVLDKTGTLTLGMPVLRNAEALPPGLLDRAARIARASSHPYARALAAAAGPGPVAQGVTESTGQGLSRGAERLGSAAWIGARGDSPLWYRDGDGAPQGFDFSDVIRPAAPALIEAMRTRGIRSEMLTGDRADIAARIAAEAGISSWQAGVTPQQKAARMESLRAAGRKVLMVGDGINDAAALALAHVSIAPGNATDISQRAADMVLRGDDLSAITEAVDVARRARRLVLQNFAVAVAYNLTAIPLAALGMVTPLVAAATMAGSSILVTLNALRLARG